VRAELRPIVLPELRAGVCAVLRSFVPAFVRALVLPFLHAGVPAVALIWRRSRDAECAIGTSVSDPKTVRSFP